jgi:hypothetical protein
LEIFSYIVTGLEKWLGEQRQPQNIFIHQKIIDMAAKRIHLHRGWGELREKGFLLDESTPAKNGTAKPNKYKLNPIFPALVRLEESLRRDAQELELTPQAMRKAGKLSPTSETYMTLGECVSRILGEKTVQDALKLSLENNNHLINGQ